jgi:hypothetical protein
MIMDNAKLDTSKKMKLKVSTIFANYELKGIVYLDEFHFTSHIITSDYKVWFHNGKITARTCYEEGLLSDFSNTDLLTCDRKMAILVVYTEKHV